MSTFPPNEPQPDDKKLHSSGHRLLNILAVFIFLFFGFIGWQVAKEPNVGDLVLLVVLAGVGGRILYELVFRRGHPPTIAMDFISRRKLAALAQKFAGAEASENYLIVDMGSGNGEVSRYLARAVPKAQVVGIELSPIAHWRAVVWQKIFGPKNVEYRKQDFFTYDCSPARLVVMYLNWRVAQVLGEKLWNELKPGAVVMSHTFELKGPWPAPEVMKFRTPFEAKLFIYRR